MGGINCYSAVAKACKSLSSGWRGSPETFSLLENEEDYTPAEILTEHEIQKLMADSCVSVNFAVSDGEKLQLDQAS